MYVQKKADKETTPGLHSTLSNAGILPAFSNQNAGTRLQTAVHANNLQNQPQDLEAKNENESINDCRGM